MAPPPATTNYKRKGIIFVILALLLAGGGFVLVKFYSYIFAKAIKGQIVKVERVNQNTVITGSREAPASQLFSFAVAVRDENGEIHTASSEDRQWAVAVPGQCAEAKFFPYAPWELDKAGTFHSARLLRLFDCPAK